jgi:hypothetical protein
MLKPKCSQPNWTTSRVCHECSVSIPGCSNDPGSVVVVKIQTVGQCQDTVERTFCLKTARRVVTGAWRR